jgi:hypothetical protein
VKSILLDRNVLFFNSKCAQTKAEGRVESQGISARIDGDGYQMDSKDDSPPDAAREKTSRL